ncbi:hypothetical protein ACJIZ3_006663 [Penstemon smallii]|uniref:Uncharacterized protein n=1 Tax=Penstemon smallii TaxID=265156 RepID=A0ABD3S8J6_9LAMI
MDNDNPNPNPTQPNQPGERNHRSSPLTYTFNGQHLPTSPPDDETPYTSESNSQTSETGQSSDSEYSHPSKKSDLPASLRIIGESMLRIELAELEMMKKRETARLEAEKLRAEIEDKMTQMILQTQLQIASFVSQNSSTRKRKHSSLNDSSSSSQRYT